jgi:hypothetical protein
MKNIAKPEDNKLKTETNVGYRDWLMIAKRNCCI